MVDTMAQAETLRIERIRGLVEEALKLCDTLGYTYAAIDLCSAEEKLKNLVAAAEIGKH